MKTLILWLRYLRVPGQIFTRKPRGSGGCRSLTSETGIIEADGPASANERAGQPGVTNQRRGRPIMGADSAWAWELATNRFTAVLWETVLDILHRVQRAGTATKIQILVSRKVNNDVLSQLNYACAAAYNAIEVCMKSLRKKTDEKFIVYKYNSRHLSKWPAIIQYQRILNA